MRNVLGTKRQQYALSLAVLDEAVESIYAAVEAKDEIDNTYFIFASDNGGELYDC